MSWARWRINYREGTSSNLSWDDWNYLDVGEEPILESVEEYINENCIDAIDKTNDGYRGIKVELIDFPPDDFLDTEIIKLHKQIINAQLLLTKYEQILWDKL